MLIFLHTYILLDLFFAPHGFSFEQRIGGFFNLTIIIESIMDIQQEIL